VVAVDDESDPPPPIESKTLRLLCIDCSALVEGAIDAAEWKRRTNFSVTASRFGFTQVQIKERAALGKKVGGAVGKVGGSG